MRFAVVGAGAVGLAPARLLQRQGKRVTLYAKDLPPNTTSNHAGAVWNVSLPTEGPARDRHVRAARLSHAYFRQMIGEHYGVRWMENYSEASAETIRSHGAGSPVHDLYPGFKKLNAGEHPFPISTVLSWYTFLIDSPIYLDALLREFRLAGGEVVVRAFPHLEALLEIPQPVIMNCTGLGAKALFHDDELLPRRGQYAVLSPQPEIDYLTDIPRDMVPRRDSLLLGAGSAEVGDWSLEPDQHGVRRALDWAALFFNAMR